MTDSAVVFDEVSKFYGEVLGVNRVTLNIPTGITSLVGPNGSGKTTLLRTAMGLVVPSHGRVTWGGRECVPPTRRAIVFQRPTMLRRSAGANIRYALRAAAAPRSQHDSRIVELLGWVGLGHLTDRPARRLSGGEQQRLALARALAFDPEVLFLDEPTASLDPTAAREIEREIADIHAAGTKTIMTTHNLGQARRLADEVLFLYQGRLIEVAPADRLFTRPAAPETAAFIEGERPWI